jgi:hypothetical protein
MKRVLCAVLFSSVFAGMASATITLTRVGDVSIYQNNQGKYYISDSCHTLGNSMDPGTTIGPGYIYRVDLNGREVVTPLSSGKAIPPTGLGVFVADMYEGDPNNPPSDPNNPYIQPPNPGNGYFESVQGNVCQGDNNNVWGSEGSGVLPGSMVDTTGTAISAADGSYLWAHYKVVLADKVGKQFEVWYWYRFYANSVQVWTKLRPCPDGICYYDSRGPSSFVKMAKFEFAINGQTSTVDYQTEGCFDVNGGTIQIAGNTTAPNGSTTKNHCNGDIRDNIRIYNSPSGLPGFWIQGQSQPSANFGPSYASYQWECNSSTCSDYGVDHLATVGANRGVHLPYDLNETACGASQVPYSNQDWMRKWEMGGDNGNNGFYPSGTRTFYAMFKGWEDGNGPISCQTLYNQMYPNEAYSNYFNISQF